MQNRLRAEVIYAKYVHTASKGDAKVAYVPMPSGNKNCFTGKVSCRATDRDVWTRLVPIAVHKF